jgi:hypothetical protein
VFERTVSGSLLTAVHTQARVYGMFMMLVITISTVTFVLETEASVKAVMTRAFAISEV